MFGVSSLETNINSDTCTMIMPGYRQFSSWWIQASRICAFPSLRAHTCFLKNLDVNLKYLVKLHIYHISSNSFQNVLWSTGDNSKAKMVLLWMSLGNFCWVTIFWHDVPLLWGLLCSLTDEEGRIYRTI
jgi:hypothetical protein